MVTSSDTWYDRLTFSFAKHPHAPVTPGREENK